MTRLPPGMHPGWDNLLRRLQSVCNRNDNKGLLVIEIKVVVDRDGQPRFWTEPKCTKVEPRKSDDILDTLINC